MRIGSSMQGGCIGSCTQGGAHVIMDGGRSRTQGGLHDVVDAGQCTRALARRAGRAGSWTWIDTLALMHAGRGAWGHGYRSMRMGLSTQMDAQGVMHVGVACAPPYVAPVRV